MKIKSRPATAAEYVAQRESLLAQAVATGDAAAVAHFTRVLADARKAVQA